MQPRSQSLRRLDPLRDRSTLNETRWVREEKETDAATAEDGDRGAKIAAKGAPKGAAMDRRYA